MRAYADTLGMHPDYAGPDPAYATETDTGSAYALVGLPIGGRFTIHAVYDLDGNGTFDPAMDAAATYPDVIWLTLERPVADSTNLVAVNTHEPAFVNGKIESPDSTARFRIEARADSDTTIVRRVERRGPGDYLLRVTPGRYQVRAIRLPGPGGIPPGAEAPGPRALDALPEEEYDHVDFSFERAVMPPTEPEPPPEE